MWALLAGSVSVFFLAGAVIAADTGFGIALGDVFAVPECKRARIGYDYSSKATCFKRSLVNEKKTTPVADEPVSIAFSAR
jgi:hypothetical protein